MDTQDSTETTTDLTGPPDEPNTDTATSRSDEAQPPRPHRILALKRELDRAAPLTPPAAAETPPLHPPPPAAPPGSPVTPSVADSAGTPSPAKGTNPASGKFSRRPQYKCSFCGKSNDEVRRLIAGPGGVYICDACIQLCNDIIAKKTASDSA